MADLLRYADERNGNKRMLFGIQTDFGMGKSIGIYPGYGTFA